MLPAPESPGQAPSSQGAPGVSPGPPGNQLVNQPSSSSSTPPPQPHFGPHERHAISLRTKKFQPPAHLPKTHVAGIADLPPFTELSNDKYDVAVESDDSSDLGGAEGKPPISLKQTEFSLKQFAKRMGQPNFSAFN